MALEAKKAVEQAVKVLAKFEAEAVTEEANKTAASGHVKNEVKAKPKSQAA